jgi:hypothetical protein
MSDTEPTAAAKASEEPTVPVAPVEPPTAAERAAAQTRLRDHLFGLRALVAVAVAGVLLGGLAGFGINAATGGDGRDGRMGRFGPGGGFRDGPGGFQGGPGQMMPGQGQQLPPQGGTQQQPAPTTAPS